MPVKRQAVQPARVAAPTVTRTGQSTAAATDAGDGTQAAPKSGAVSLASAFDETPAASNIGGYTPPPGKYEAIIVEAKVLDPNAKGQAIAIGVEICDAGDSQGKKVVMYYNMIDANGKPHQGAGFFKRDMGKLGFPEMTGAQIDEVLDIIAKELTPVAITVKLNSPYTNTYLDGLVEGSEIIAEWKANRPPTPF